MWARSCCPGLVGLKAVHQQKAAERTAPPEADNLYIDIGAKSREEAEAAVTLGDRVSFAQNYARFGEGFVRAKALDNRLAVPSCWNCSSRRASTASPAPSPSRRRTAVSEPRRQRVRFSRTSA